MYEVIFYEDKNGYSEVESLLKVMSKDAVTNKQSRVNLNRIVAYYKDNTFIILTHFIKKTKKTPKREIERAIRYLKDYTERK